MKEKTLNRVSLLALTLALIVALSVGFALLDNRATAWDGTVGTAFASGSGTQADPYIIENESQFAYFIQSSFDGATYAGQYISLNNALDMSRLYKSGGTFAGNFNGNGYEITTIQKLFSTIASGGTVNAVRVTTIGGGSGIICDTNNGTITNVVTNGLSYGKKYVGHICNINNGIISNCGSVGELSADNYYYTTGSGYNTETVTVHPYVGIVGCNNGSMSNCYFAGSVVDIPNGTTYGSAPAGSGTTENCQFSNNGTSVTITAASMNTNTISGYTWYTVSGLNGGNPIVMSTNSNNAARYTVTIDGEASFDSTCATFSLTRNSSYGTIYYTTDGTNPTTASSNRKTATSGALIAIPGNVTVKAVVYYNGTYGIVSSKDFYYSGKVTIGDPLAKYLPDRTLITLIPSDGSGTCYYTLDGTDPCSSTTRKTYSVGTSIELEGGVKQTLKAVLYYREAYGTVASKTFTPIATSGTAGENVTWSYSGGTLTISGSGAMADLTESAAQPWAALKSYITQVVVGNGVTTVGAYSFADFTEMTSVSISKSVTSLGQSAFYGCSALESVSIPDSVTDIGAKAFYGCSSFTSLVIPDSVNTIGSGALTGCGSLTTLTIPFVGTKRDNPTGRAALFGELFETPSGSTTQYIMFYQSYYPTTASTSPSSIRVYLPVSLTKVIVTGGEINDYAFHQCSTLTSITLPSTATRIGQNAFYGTSITSITIPSTVTELGMYCLGATKIKEVTIPSSVGKVTERAFYDCDSLETVNIPVGITEIGSHAFAYCEALKTVTIPETVKTIGSKAFVGANSVTKVNYITADYDGYAREWAHISFADAESNPMQGGNAYLYLNGSLIKYLSVTGGTSSGSAAYSADISAYSFYRCQNEITILANGGYSGNIGKYAFYGSNIIDADFPSDTGNIGEHAFDGCTKLTSCYRLMEGATTIGNYAFYNTGITASNLAENTRLTYIGQYAFSKCSKITSVTIPATVKTIGYGAFEDSTNLTKITFLGRNASVGTYAFNGVTASVTYPCGATCAGSNYGGTLTWNVDPSSHSYTNYVSDGNATCLADGTKTALCDYSCGTKDTVTDTDSKLGHDYQITAQTNTCTADGTITYTCSRCNDSYTEDAAKLGHDYVKTIVPATCTEDGYTDYTCSRCGDSYQEDIVDATGHSWSSTVVAPTCTEQGYTKRNCENCGAEKIVSYTEPLGHKITTYTSDNVGSSANTHSGECSVCGQTITEACSFEDTVIDPTCTKAGYTKHTCTVCGYSYNNNNVKKTGHTLTLVTAKAPTCTESGNIEYWVCEACGLYFDDDTAEYQLDADEILKPATGHTAETIPAVAATCTESGLTAGSKCSVCGEVFTAQEAVPALGHNYESAVTPATCTEAGYTTYTCSRCDDSHTADATEALGHSEKDVAGKNPTCTATGLTAGKVCERCGAVLQAQEEIPMVAHTPGEAVEENRVEATEQTPGHYDSVVYCTVCGAEISRETREITELTHTYVVASVTEATCTERGYTTYICQGCGTTYKDDYTEALGHAPETIPGYEATDDEDGLTEGSRCTRCGEILIPQTIIPALGHDYVVTSETPATCTQPGSKVWTCETCGHSYTEEIPATGHLEEIIPAVDATCTEAGYTEGIRCSECGETLTAQTEIPALGHSAVTDAAVPAGEHTDGLTEGSHCSRCGEVLVEQVPVTATCHSADQLIKTETAPTCTTAGSITYTCVGGEYTVTEAGAPALGHDYKAAVTAPTCTAGGYTTYTCSRCGDSYKTDETAATGHNPVTDAAVAATCTTAGKTEGSHCSVCGATIAEQQTIAALGHNYSSVVTAPTCTEKGYTTHTCSRCGNTYKDSETAALGHNYTSTVTTAATCTTSGVRTYKCSRCGRSYTRTIAALGHSYTSAVTTEPTCTTEGVRTYTCSRCKNTYTEAVAALGHNYVSGVCTRCGKAEISGIIASGTCGANLTWRLSDEGTLTIGGTGAMADYDSASIPWLSNKDAVKEVVIESGTTEIGDYAFADCRNLTSLTISESVKSIGTCAFAGCDGLTVVTFEGNAPVFGDETFKGDSLTIRYPASDASWTPEVMQQYGGQVTWQPYCTGAHSAAADNSVPATCTEDGKTEGSHCSVCGEVLVAQESIPALGHDLTYTEAKAATCTTAGNTEYWTCSRCGRIFSDEDCTTEITAENTLIAALGHDLIHTEAKEPTVTEPGNIAYWTCSRCSRIYSDEACTQEISQEDIIRVSTTLEHHPAVEAGYGTDGNPEYWYNPITGKYYSDPDGLNEMDPADVVILARDYFIINYVMNGGTNAAGNPTQLQPGFNRFTLYYPTREGYVFDGWYTSADFADDAYAAAPEVNYVNVESDITLYAKWNPVTYSITFDGNGTKTGKMPTYTSVLYDEELTLPANAFTRKGYDFTGWNTAKDGTGTSIADKETVCMLANTEGTKVTLYAQWEPTKYTITYVLYGSTNNSINPETYTISSPTITLAAPTGTGLGSFLGWYSDPAFKTKATSIKVGSTGNKTFYAKWSGTTFSISYELYGGKNDPTNPTTYNSSETVTLLAPVSAPSADCTFAGWYSDPAFKTKVTTIKAGSYGNLILYAKWNAKTKYTIRYELYGGKNAKNPTSYTAVTPTITLLDPTLKGYTFLGWFKNVKCTGEPVTEIAAGSQGDLTLHAGWKMDTYTITYQTRGGMNASYNPSTYTVETETVKLANPTRTGYTFGGWYSDSALKTKVTQIKKGSTGDITLYAKWTANKYTVKFNGNGNSTSKTSGSMPTQSVNYSSCITLKANKFTRKGFIFTGWNTMPDGSGAAYKDGATILNLSRQNKTTVTLYAQWEAIVYNISYELNGGEKPAEGYPAAYTAENALTLVNPTRTGYTFAGWYTDSRLKTKANLKAGNIGDKTFYAKWTANKYTVKFDANGGTGKMSNLSLTYDAPKALTGNAFKRTGYTFAGWALTPDGTSLYGNKAKNTFNLTSEPNGIVTLYAVWTPDS